MRRGVDRFLANRPLPDLLEEAWVAGEHSDVLAFIGRFIPGEAALLKFELERGPLGGLRIVVSTGIEAQPGEAREEIDVTPSSVTLIGDGETVEVETGCE